MDQETSKKIKDLVAVEVEPMLLVEMVEAVIQALVLVVLVVLEQQLLYKVLL